MLTFIKKLLISLLSLTTTQEVKTRTTLIQHRYRHPKSAIVRAIISRKEGGRTHGGSGLGPCYGAIPGTYFWKPRLGLDLAIPTTEFNVAVSLRNKENIRAGLCVLIDGYTAGMSVIAVAAGLSSGPTYPHLDPMSAYFYTNIYRWALRYISLLPFWIGGKGGNYCDTHRVWKRRYYYMDEFMPSWLQSALFYVKKEEWAKELLEYQRFKKYAEPAFGKHYRYPTKHFNKFKSFETVETIEDPHEVSELSII